MRLLTLMATLLALSAGALAQSDGHTDELPRTPWGAPDLQGLWDIRTTTPLQRPEEFADRPMLSPAEAEAYHQRRVDAYQRLRSTGNNADWTDLLEVGLTEGGRTSRIIDPPDGRIPARTEDGQQRRDTLGQVDGRRSANGPEDRPPQVRCIVRQSLPVTPLGYNNNLRIFQTPDHVVLLHEMIHEALIVPLDGRPHLPEGIAQWHGDGRGYWDGESLVVETTNLHPGWTYQGTGPNARFIERFTRLDAETLRYEFTVDDAESFTRPWTERFDLSASDGRMYEYACHEGNRSMPLLLEVARAEERAEATSR